MQSADTSLFLLDGRFRDRLDALDLEAYEKIEGVLKSYPFFFSHSLLPPIFYFCSIFLTSKKSLQSDDVELG